MLHNIIHWPNCWQFLSTNRSRKQYTNICMYSFQMTSRVEISHLNVLYFKLCFSVRGKSEWSELLDINEKIVRNFFLHFNPMWAIAFIACICTFNKWNKMNEPEIPFHIHHYREFIFYVLKFDRCHVNRIFWRPKIRCIKWTAKAVIQRCNIHSIGNFLLLLIIRRRMCESFILKHWWCWFCRWKWFKMNEQRSWFRIHSSIL